jgi:hypothetical protein
MRKGIIFVSLLTVFLMMMIPNISAVEYQTAIDVNKSYMIQVYENKELELNKFIEILQKIDINKLKNIDYNLFEIFIVLLNIYGIIFNFIRIFKNPDFAILHFLFMITHIFLLIYWITSD